MPYSPPLAQRLTGSDPCALFEDNRDLTGGRLLSGCLRVLHAWQADELSAFFSAIEEVQTQGRWVALAASYELGYALDPVLAPLMPASTRPLVTAWVFESCVDLDSAGSAALLDEALQQIPASQREAGLTPFHATLNETSHASAFSRVQALIAAGDCYQVNLTFPLRAGHWGHPLALHARLRESQPVQHGVFLQHEEGWLLSRSPELFVARTGQRLTVRPMKGTAPLGQAARLAASEKDRAENLMIVDLLRNDLGRLAPAGGVRVTRLFEIEDYASLHQMTSTIEAAPVEAGLADIFRALFPCGSVTGAPKIRAMQIIRELEAESRGVYCGAIGWIAPDGDFSFNVPIRTLELDRAGAVRMGVGSGIVADSVAASEYAECLAKGRFASALAPGFTLFETLRLVQGDEPYPLLGRHMERLARSAAELGFRLDAEQARTTLLELAAELAEGLPPGAEARVRLDLSADGSIRLQHAPLDAPPPRLTVTLSPFRVASTDPLLRHKSSRRSDYDRLLREAMAAGHFDALCCNERGEVCEGARSNVFIERDGMLLTPPVDSGLLPGVMRAELLANGEAREARLFPQDLVEADARDALFVANALRGLVPVRLSLSGLPTG